jgi:hypothetical protein
VQRFIFFLFANSFIKILVSGGFTPHHFHEGLNL